MSTLCSVIQEETGKLGVDVIIDNGGVILINFVSAHFLLHFVLIFNIVILGILGILP